MIELAHFLQFLSFSFGLLAIYVGYQTLKQSKVKPLKKYLLFLVGVNLIVFVHVLEAFFKIVFDPEFYNNEIRPVFTVSMYPLAFLRLYMASLFLSFCSELSGKKENARFTYLAIGIFVVFIGLMSYFYIAPRNMTLHGEISFWAIHFLLFTSLVAGAFILLSQRSKSSDLPKITFFSYFIIIYATVYIFFRSINSWIVPASEHTQMAGLGITALVYNLFNIFILKKTFATKFNLSDAGNGNALTALFEKYGITNREQEIVRLICEGKTNKEIAEKLFISPVTVRDHVSNIFRKTNVKNRTQAASLFQPHIS